MGGGGDGLVMVTLVGGEWWLQLGGRLGGGRGGVFSWIAWAKLFYALEPS